MQSRKPRPPGLAAHPATSRVERSGPPAGRSDSPCKGTVHPRTPLTRPAMMVFTLSQVCWGILAEKTLRSAPPGEGQLSSSPAIPVPCAPHGPADMDGAAMNDTVADIWPGGANRHRSNWIPGGTTWLPRPHLQHREPELRSENAGRPTQHAETGMPGEWTPGFNPREQGMDEPVRATPGVRWEIGLALPAVERRTTSTPLIGCPPGSSTQPMLF